MKSKLALAIVLAGLPWQGSIALADNNTGSAGLRLEYIDPAMSPAVDFYRYANGRWHDAYVFRPDESYAGARPDLIALRKQRIRSIIDDAMSADRGGQVATIVGSFYASFLDEDAINAAGLQPARADLARIRHLSTKQDVLDLFAEAPAQGLPSVIGASIFYDFHSPGRLRYMITPAGMGLPQRELYLDESEKARKLRDQYVEYVADMLAFTGAEEPKQQALLVLALETEIARLSWPSADAYNPLKTANSVPFGTLKELAPGIDWDRFLKRAGVGKVDTVIIAQPSAMPQMAKLIAETPVSVWRSWATLHYLSANAPYLSSDIAERRFAFFDRTLGGQQAQSPRWQRGIELVESSFGDALGQLYVERYFPERNKRLVEEMFGNIRAVMRERIEAAPWMSEPTRSEALKKIDTLNVKIGYPDAWPSYGDLSFSRSDFYGNLKKARKRNWQDRAALVHAPLPRQRWMTTAQTSGAAANPNLNEITIPAGALEPPYFDPDADPAVNYGAIGAIMGHELSHLFDQLGRQMDATGKLRDWWAPEDARRYEEIASRVINQYEGLALGPDLKVNGRITQNENIADVAGLSVAYAAWKRAIGDRPAAEIDGFTGDQRFFLAWAQMRRGKMTEAALRRQLASGPHAPDEIRGGQPMRNMEAWYTAFGIKPGDPSYVAPEMRAVFW